MENDITTAAPPERLIALEGAQNFRDLGGYVGADGRRVRWRRVFRAAALQGLTTHDADTLASLAMADVFDLRTRRETDYFGTNPLAPRGVRTHYVPFVDEIGRSTNREAAPARPADPGDPRPVAEGYLSMLERGKPAVARVFAHLAAEPTGSTVFHCTAGKDRTGMMAALLLSALGVDEETIAADYALTASYLRYDEASASAMAAFYGMPQRASGVTANPDVIGLMLTGLGARYGSPLGYLESAGVADGQLDALRETLLEG